jgi:hypothetical protein
MQPEGRPAGSNDFRLWLELFAITGGDERSCPLITPNPSDPGALCQRSNAIRGALPPWEHCRHGSNAVTGALPSRERENGFDLDQNVGGEELANLH